MRTHELHGALDRKVVLAGHTADDDLRDPTAQRRRELVQVIDPRASVSREVGASLIVDGSRRQQAFCAQGRACELVESRGHDHPLLGRCSISDAIERMDSLVDHLQRDFIELAQRAWKLRSERSQA